jgi:hypothetical protein
MREMLSALKKLTIYLSDSVVFLHDIFCHLKSLTGINQGAISKQMAYSSWVIWGKFNKRTISKVLGSGKTLRNVRAT